VEVFIDVAGGTLSSGSFTSLAIGVTRETTAALRIVSRGTGRQTGTVEKVLVVGTGNTVHTVADTVATGSVAVLTDALFIIGPVWTGVVVTFVLIEEP
jgi:hypothetical protein